MTQTKTSKILNWILNVLLVVSGVAVVILLGWRVFGNSPTDFQIIIGLTGFLGTAILKNFSLSYNLNREFGKFRIKTMHSFNMIKKDMQEIKEAVKSKAGRGK